MSELPTGWAEANLLDLCQPKQWKVISTAELTDSGYVVYGANGKIGFYSTYTHEKPTLMITCRGATCGNLHVSEPRSYINGNAMALDSLAEEITSVGFLRYALRARGLADAITGTAQPQITRQSLSEVTVKLAPIAEQTRIAQKLDELLAQVDTLKARIDAIPALLKRFRQSVLAAAVSGQLTEAWRATSDHAVDMANAAKIHQNEWLSARERECQRKQKEYCENKILRKFKPESFQKDKHLPPSWLTTSLSNLAEITDPNPSHRMPKYMETGTPFISTENFGSNERVDFSVGKKVTEEELEAQRSRYEITEGTFAFTRIGTIGRSVFLPTPHNYCISHAVAVVQPYIKLTAPKFLKLVASAPSTLSQATDGVQSVGVPDLGIGKMKSFKIPMPPIDEQTEIVRRIEQFFGFADQLEAKVATAQARIDRLTQSILAKAFRGELVPQDPNDEPASQLLERIQAQRAAAPKAKRGRKSA